MSAALVALVALLLLAVQSTRHSARTARDRAATARANRRAMSAAQRAVAAERRLEAARDLMLSVAESVAKDAPRPRRAPVSVPAPACPVCASREVAAAVVTASRLPVAAVTGLAGWQPPFVVRWGAA